MPRLTLDPRTGREIHPDDDYPYDRDPCRDDPRRHLPNDTESVYQRQMEANERGEPYFPTPWECWNIGKHWNVPKLAHDQLIEEARPANAMREMIEPKLNDPGLYHGAPGEVPTPWDGSLAGSANWGNIVTTTRIGILWLEYKPEALGKSTRDAKAIGSCMRDFGWKQERTRIPGMSTRPLVWIKPDWHPEEVQEMPQLPQLTGNGSRTMDDDIPF